MMGRTSASNSLSLSNGLCERMKYYASPRLAHRSEPDFPARRRRGAPAVAIDYGHGRGHCSRTDSFATSEACLGPVEGFAPGGIRTWDLSIPAQLHNQLRNPPPLVSSVKLQGETIHCIIYGKQDDDHHICQSKDSNHVHKRAHFGAESRSSDKGNQSVGNEPGWG